MTTHILYVHHRHTDLFLYDVCDPHEDLLRFAFYRLFSNRFPFSFYTCSTLCITQIYTILDHHFQAFSSGSVMNDHSRHVTASVLI